MARVAAVAGVVRPTAQARIRQHEICRQTRIDRVGAEGCLCVQIGGVFTRQRKFEPRPAAMFAARLACTKRNSASNPFSAMLFSFALRLYVVHPRKLRVPT